MVSTCIGEEDLNRFVNRLHPNLVFPKYHGCDWRNRSGTRKSIDYKRGQQCLMRIIDPYWRVTKDKYEDKGRIYLTRQTVCRLKWAKTMFIINALQ